MNTPTFKEQFDKLTRAYINCEVNPFKDCACFVGNLLNRNNEWGEGRCIRSGGEFQKFAEELYVTDNELLVKVLIKEANSFYTPNEIIEIEKCFLIALRDNGYTKSHKNENSLFIAFEQTLSFLKKIHESKGEKIDSFEFKKRELQPV